MAKSQSTNLAVSTRQPAHSRETRRLRRGGRVPGVLYGLGSDPVALDVDARELRHALAATGAVLELAFDGTGSGEPAVVKDTHRHPVRGEILHIDFLRVDLKVKIQAVVTVELVGGDDAPGVKEGGILTHETRELHVEALPGDIPETLQVDVSGLAIGENVSLTDVQVPSGVELLDDPEATIIASVTPPTVESEPTDEVESETAVVGEAAAEGDAEEAGGEETAGDDAAGEE